jgi:hypothetical protein
MALGRKLQYAAAAVGLVLQDLNQAAPLEGLQSGRQRGAVHGKQRRNRAHRWGLGAIERHEEGKLSVGQAEGAQHFIESPRQGARRPLYVQAETTVPNQERCFVRDRFWA